VISTGDLTLFTQFGPSGGGPTVNADINSLSVTLSNVNLADAGASVVLTVYVCEDTTDLGGAGNHGSLKSFTGCGGSAGSNTPTNGTLVSDTVTLSGAATASTVIVTVSLGEVISAAAIDVNVDLTSDSQGPASFSGMSLDFGETTPEPSTFVLTGSALAGLGFFAARRRKAQRAS
jgi:hypothetical protein